MQPYQKAAVGRKQQNEMPQNVVKGGFNVVSQMMPLLSQYVPPLLALKGLSTLNSGIGKFIGAAKKSGEQPEAIIDFIRHKVSPQQENQQIDQGQELQQEESSPQQQNIIQRLAPSVYQEMVQLINKGMSPLKAAAKLKSGLGIFANSIKQIEDQTKTDWLSIVESIFGRGDMAQPQQQQPQEHQPQAQGGQGQQALMQMLQKINQRMGK